MDFTVQHNSIFTWKGFASFKEQHNTELTDSYCQLIIAEENTTRVKWIVAIDQGFDTGTSITNCVGFLAPLVCNVFSLDLGLIRWLEVYNHPDEMTIDEVVITDVEDAYLGQPKINFKWKPCRGEIRSQAEKIIEMAGCISVDQTGITDKWLKKLGDK